MTSQCEGRAPANRSMATTSRPGIDAGAVVDHPLGGVGLLLVEHREHVPRRPGTDGAVAALDAFQHVHVIVFPAACPVVSSAPLRAARRARIRGRLAQRESARLTRGRSLVQIQHRPPYGHTDRMSDRPRRNCHLRRRRSSIPMNRPPAACFSPCPSVALPIGLAQGTGRPLPSSSPHGPGPEGGTGTTTVVASLAGPAARKSWYARRHGRAPRATPPGHCAGGTIQLTDQ